jgi:hypothetical protein
VQISIGEQGNAHNDSLSRISLRQFSVCGSAGSNTGLSGRQILAKCGQQVSS